ncbi:putative reverse transcriptase zinc-binding domain-containing protein [Helianthus annuus]|uniref:Reverse transcriptase zinc-binding domain-containing protein n=1 Tax=Helianthus annuus TaxID=4232 RepID=A0A9K3NMN5_HELAN|nr:putative reverse transcriptase zinc-binding domain-containing protein [Helianthus annuus]KAJ0569849.1 putative reverse transcriptase zinc-binding domain-containing protein [Helianthus annuus]KAJ0584178.1 putative reverse transcriptase zinc-binding domain-containing protein [Helianthus annuus]KAJ0749847.1 putative reverse transcriptase zinc-binding domain-containing protein [Helianthus annuus]KAJ0918496.1 putative reverse transcriptase zinc-binding domain-containing protein [Helianthus annuus
MEKKIDSWLNKSLSFAGRLQLINSVLSSMHIYWASVFIIPARVIHDLEKFMRRFLWNAGSQGRAKAKVAWSDVCLPKTEGGLGIRSISDVNKALMTSHIWSIVTRRKSLWVDWIYAHKLNDRSFWDVNPRGSVSWGWRKLLAIRGSVRPYIWKEIRSGRQTKMWTDNWCHLSPLSAFITPRRIAQAGFSMSSTVADLIDGNGQWKWPVAWYNLFPVLINLEVPQLSHDMLDRTVWRDLEGKSCSFRSLEVWNVVRHRESIVPWFNGVWFSQCIPRHSFHLWLVIKNKLKTQDRLAVWEVGSATNLNLMCCPLCRNNRDSRDHLFFRCSFSSKVWNDIKAMASLDQIDDSWQSVMDWMFVHASSKKVDHIVCKLVIAATTYFIWLERNNCLFSNDQAKVESVVVRIKNIVRLRLMGFEFKGDSKVDRMLKTWEIAASEQVGDPG